jgi:hypothetical protein
LRRYADLVGPHHVPDKKWASSHSLLREPTAHEDMRLLLEIIKAFSFCIRFSAPAQRFFQI